MPETGDVDRQIEQLMECKALSEAEVKTPAKASEGDSGGGVECSAVKCPSPLARHPRPVLRSD
ncbi:hypothetical protein Bca52824_083915 [Brassica carinata]|uniref:Uncharacterized protein n=1 Tax=Brassica carinata TaxID=52824 RepID=A0A8X7PQH3_BRACI|nr:hypothetical protein Bca52824_083915 [Brassica carinata]